jgi:dTDP-4-amino-4,6-dideoxygalactose transaminase
MTSVVQVDEFKRLKRILDQNSQTIKELQQRATQLASLTIPIDHLELRKENKQYMALVKEYQLGIQTVLHSIRTHIHSQRLQTLQQVQKVNRRVTELETRNAELVDENMFLKVELGRLVEKIRADLESL